MSFPDLTAENVQTTELLSVEFLESLASEVLGHIGGSSKTRPDPKRVFMRSELSGEKRHVLKTA